MFAKDDGILQCEFKIMCIRLNYHEQGYEQ